MTIWAFLLLIACRAEGHNGLPDVAPISVVSPMVAIIRSDSSLPHSSKRDGLPDCDDEREEEDDGEDDSASARALLQTGSLFNTPLLSAAIATSNRRVQGLDLGARVAVLRC